MGGFTQFTLEIGLEDSVKFSCIRIVHFVILEFPALTLKLACCRKPILMPCASLDIAMSCNLMTFFVDEVPLNGVLVPEHHF
jgi:hypothetical protein